MKYAFIDTETTGCDEVHSVWQVAIILTDENYKETDRLEVKFRPRTGCKLAQGAMDKTGMTPEKFMAIPLSYEDGYKAIIKFLDKHLDRYNKKDKAQFVAYNAQFDARFMRQLFKDNGDDYFGSWFWHPPICVMMHAAWMVREQRDSWESNFQLASLCAAAKINFKEEDAHDAMYDIEKTLELYKYFV